MYNIPYGRQHITDEDIVAVTDVLKSDFLTQGPQILKFEKLFAEYIGCKYAVAVANGTAALHLSSLALGVQPGDKVITTPITFAASANCIRYCGGEVVFADIDPETYLLDIKVVEKMLLDAPKGTYKGIVVVDFAGRGCDLEAFKTLATQHNLWLLEDACHAPGGYFLDQLGKPQKCGNGNFADMAIFSFHPVKHIACGEGGMITTNSKELYELIIKSRTHGITREESQFRNPKSLASSDKGSLNYPGWYMEMQTLGYNYRLTDIQAALGIAQLTRAAIGLAKRHSIAARYYDAFRNQPEIKGQSGVVNGHAYHLYIIEVENRMGLYNYLKEHGIFTQVHYLPIHLMPYYQQFGWKAGDLPNAESYYSSCLSLPMFPTLTDDEQSHVIKKILTFINK